MLLILIINKMVRKTKQKQIIEKEVRKFKSFFYADELYHEVNKQKNVIGIATIYRYLKDLINRGEIHSYQCNRKTLYSFSKENHCHFICKKCASLTHINLKKLDFLHEEIKGKICHLQLDITGTCEKCLKENKNSIS